MRFDWTTTLLLLIRVTHQNIHIPYLLFMIIGGLASLTLIDKSDRSFNFPTTNLNSEFERLEEDDEDSSNSVIFSWSICACGFAIFIPHLFMYNNNCLMMSIQPSQQNIIPFLLFTAVKLFFLLTNGTINCKRRVRFTLCVHWHRKCRESLPVFLFLSHWFQRESPQLF